MIRVRAYREMVAAVGEGMEENGFDMPGWGRAYLLLWFRTRIAWFLWIRRLPLTPDLVDSTLVPRAREIGRGVGVDWWWRTHR